MIRRLKSDKQIESIGAIRQSFLNGLTVEQINTYIDNNITDLSSAKVFLKKLSKIILYMLRHSNIQ